MYLKSIEVQGFKSFANKLKFEFHQGITGIVGPNGSGKSNVADAVRWVLGEQSAKSLRAGGMQDVIFAGTESRKPQSFASVAITFDNSDHMLDVDYEEVTVTRRLYRSGESEYLLNNSPVRLRDINDIFYDTGIGKEGYSIIGQGQVERILNGKPEERRELFDEAAGIVKFKKRKAAALKKLENEHQDLLRVNDILKELTDRLGPLEKQAKTARLYLDKKAELKALDISLFRIEDERTGKQLEDIENRLQIAMGDMEETKTKFDRTRAEYEEIENSISSIDAESEELSKKSSQNALLRQQLSGQIDILNEQIRSIRSVDEQNRARRTEIAESIRQRTDELRAEKEKLVKERKENEAVLSQEKEAEQKLSEIDQKLADTNARIDAAKNDVIGMLNSRASVKSRIQHYDTMLEQLEIRRSEIDQRLLRLHEQQDAARKEADSFISRSRELKEESAALTGQRETLEKEEAALRKKMNDDAAHLEERMQQYHRDSSRLTSLKAMAEHYDGYSNGIRKIMEQRDRNPGIRGVVADLISVPEKYETAIETALGGSIRHIVTDNEATAKYLIEYLKANRLGRCTFLPLTSIRGRSLGSRDILRETGVIGVAADLVSTDAEYENLKDYLLGRIVVVDNIDHAIAIGRKYRHSAYMVTLAGESFAPGGSITGGAFRNTENLLGRRREIDTLTTETRKLKKETDALREAAEADRARRNEIRDKISAVNEKVQKLQLDMNTAALRAKNADEQLRVAGIDRSSLEKERTGIETQMAEIRGKNDDIAKTLETSVRSEKEINEKTDSLRSTQEELTHARETCADELEKVRVKLAQAEEQQRFSEDTVKRLTGEIAELDKQAGDLEGNLTGSAGETEVKQKQIAEVEETIRAAEAEDEQTAKRRAELAEKKQSLSESHREFFKKRDELSDRMARLDKETFRLNAQKERLSEGREERVSYMWDEYNMTPSEIRTVVLPEQSEDRAAVKKQIASLKNAIRGLGTVNVNAIEEYKEQSGRYEFLSAQHEDLIKSEDTLKGIIRELDEGMRKQFTEQFALIRTEFDKAFQELFGGGHGTLELDPDVDVLEAPVSIIAHPPGKKLQNMMQLSGGEKSLTAIALLFAIQNLKPSPFCLLDEIEASLDESNVVRFAEYLHKLTKNTQFIIITHRRGTMNQCDRLYGITMQEKGVSTLVSVNLIEDKLSK